MALMGRKSEEEKAAKAARKEQERAEAEERKRRQAIERARADFFDSPAGKARVAFGAGEQVFPVRARRDEPAGDHRRDGRLPHREADIRPERDSELGLRRRLGARERLVRVCTRGLAKPRQVHVLGPEPRRQGTTVGYYLFRRCEVNRREVGNPWETKLAFDAEVEEMAAEEATEAQSPPPA
jgi:hypothetical protein